MKLLDTTQRWFIWSTGNFTIILVLHLILSGWILRQVFFWNYYNIPPNGPYISNAAHFWASYAIAALLMNLHLPRAQSGRVKRWIVLVIIAWIALVWEWFEFLITDKMGWGIGYLDTMLNMTTGMLGAILGVVHAERSIP